MENTILFYFENLLKQAAINSFFTLEALMIRELTESICLAAQISKVSPSQ